ncbi:MAG: aldo/keto reductase [Eubacteriales bacterium]|nr:aldo/keto reductase [Eubacteriales bacterium]
MQYRLDRNGNKLSVLGFGCMRFTRKGSGVDIDKAEREILAAYEQGVNYYDTAYVYSGSEEALGEILERNRLRGNVNIAAKLPQYLVGSIKAADRYFEKELSRLRTDYVDYYLMHMMTDIAQWEKLEKFGIRDWIRERKESGAIRNIGFSYHGNTENFKKILDVYDWDFCQIQYNYMDDVSQAGREGLLAAASKGLPVIIMEPLLGGKLVNQIPESAARLMRESGRGWSKAEWGLRWLYDQPEVTVVLSGMNSLKMVEENCRIASEARQGDMTEDDRQTLESVKQIIKRKEKVGCTGCRYCMPCPHGVDIPGIFYCYNSMYTDSKKTGRHRFFQTVALTRKPAFASMCVGCGRCERLCPQGIPIREKLKEADRALRPLPYKIGITAARKVLFRG